MNLKEFIRNLRDTNHNDETTRKAAHANLKKLFDTNGWNDLFNDLRTAYRKQEQERKGMI